MQIKIRNLSNLLGIIFLFGMFLYGFVPFEMPNPTQTQNIHLLCIIAIISYVIFAGYYKDRYHTFDLVILLFFALLFTLGEMISKERDGMEFMFSILFGHVVASALYYSEYFKSKFLTALKWLIILSVTLLVLQYIILMLTGNIFQIHSIVFPFSEARTMEDAMFGLYRMGGMYIEPGTYSNMMYIFLILYMILSQRTDSLLLYIGAASIILTASVWGLVFGLYMLVILLFIKLIKIKEVSIIKRVFSTLVLISISFAGTSYILESSLLKYAEHKIKTDNPSVDAKELAFSRFQESYDDFLIVGEGFNPEFNIGIPSVQDAGLLLNLTVVFGVLASLIIMAVYLVSILRCCSWVMLLVSLPILTSKLFYTDRVFWLLFFVVIFGAYKKSKYIATSKQ